MSDQTVGLALINIRLAMSCPTLISLILVTGSIFSASPMLTSGIQRAQLTWAHLLPLLKIRQSVRQLQDRYQQEKLSRGRVIPGRLHCSASLWTELTLRLHVISAGTAVPFAFWNVLYAVAGLMDADVAPITEYHLITVLTNRLYGTQTTYVQ